MMNGELSNKAKVRLYVFTSLSCLLWLGQSIYEAISLEQEVFSIYNIIFYLSLLIVMGYTAYSAYSLWRIPEDD